MEKIEKTKNEKKGIKLTERQSYAVNLKNTNILVSAAAGSGKTRVLVERIKSQIMQGLNYSGDDNSIGEKYGISPEEFLVCTFTNAATEGMRSRIRKDIRTRRLPVIKTLDSFAREIVKQFGYMLGIDPKFTVMDGSEEKILKRKILKELIEEYYENDDKYFKDFVDAFDPNGVDENIYTVIEKFSEYTSSRPKGSELFKMSVEGHRDFNSEIFSEWQCTLQKKIDAIRVKIKSMYDEFLTVIERELGKEEKYYKFVEFESGYYSKLQIPGKDENPFGKKLPNLPKDGYIKEVVNASKDKNRKKAIDLVKKTLENELEIQKNFLEYKHLYEKNANRLEIVQKISHEFIDRVSGEMKATGKLSFSEISRKALELLEVEEVAKYYKNKYKYIYVDEFQDISDAQEVMISKVATEGRLFMVGDVKQSIYGFRLANPDNFLSKFNEFSVIDYEGNLEKFGDNEGKYLPISQNTRVDLNENFRTRRNILNFANCIFRKAMTKDFGGIEYDENSELNYGIGEDDSFGGEIEVYDVEVIKNNLKKIENLENSENSENLENSENPESQGNFGNNDSDKHFFNEKDYRDFSNSDSSESDAPDVSSSNSDELSLAHCLLLRDIVQNQVGREIVVPEYNKEKDKLELVTRKCEYKDIAIIYRSLSTNLQKLERVFNESFIPFIAEKRRGYFETLEISLVFSMLKLIYNPLSDIDLMAVFRMPMVGLSNNQIVAISKISGSYLFDKLRKIFLYFSMNNNTANNLNIEQTTQTVDSPEFFEDNITADDYQDTDNLLSENEIKLINKYFSEYEINNLLILINELDALNKKTRFLSIVEVIEEIFAWRNFYLTISSIPGGSERRKNLDLLLARATLYKQSDIVTIADFISYISELLKNKEDVGTALNIEDNNYVNVITTHKSKGLEFPVVILADVSKKFNLRDLDAPLLIYQKEVPDEFELAEKTENEEVSKEKSEVVCKSDEKDNEYFEEKVNHPANSTDVKKAMKRAIGGVTLSMIDEEEGIKYDSVPSLALKEQISIMLKSEELRLLYVAITRAQSKLIILKEKKLGNKIDDIITNPSYAECAYNWINMGFQDYKDNFAAATGETIEKSIPITTTKTGAASDDAETLANQQQNGVKTDFIMQLSEEIKEEIDRRISFVLPPIKEVAKRKAPSTKGDRFNLHFKKPKALQKNDSIDKGLYIHKAFEFIDYTKDEINLEDIRKQMEKHNFHTEHDLSSIEEFFHSELAQRIRKSKKVLREQPFVIQTEDENYQGRFDLVFEEEDGFVLLDYKSDYISKKDEGQILDKISIYKNQINKYTHAIINIMGAKVKERYIYFTSINKLVKVD